MNAMKAGNDKSSTSIFDDNMKQLKIHPSVEKFDESSSTPYSTFVTIGDVVVVRNSNGSVETENLGSTTTSSSSTTAVSSSWSLILSLVSASSSSSSSSSSLITRESPSSSTWISLPTSTYRNSDTLDNNNNNNNRDSKSSIVSKTTDVTSSSSLERRLNGVASIIDGVDTVDVVKSPSRYSNVDDEVVRSSGSSTTSTVIGSSSNGDDNAVVILDEINQREYDNLWNRDNTASSQSWNDDDDEGFASGDENGDDSESDDKNSTIESSGNRDIVNFTNFDNDNQNNHHKIDDNIDDDLLFGFSDTMEQIKTMNFNSTFYDNDNTSTWDYNDTDYVNESSIIVLGDGMYPSGYSLWQIILASIAATVLMIVVIVGNMLVIIAIATEKALKNIGNWFIASLAVADFFLGLIIMPFSLANEIMGYWIFGYWWCDIYSAMDVLLCTASIMNLCLISLDRFWSITQAIDYLKKRTPARVALMITMVWLLSALICIPPLLGWKRPPPAEEYPKCSLSEDIGYVLYSALGSFYIPSCIMVFVYIRIYFAAKARARRGIRKQPRPRPAMQTESPDIRQTSFTQSTPATDSRRTPGTMENVATIENQPVQIPIVTCDFASDVSTSEVEPGCGSVALEEKDTLKVSMPIPMQKTNLKATLSVNGSSDGGSTGQTSIPARCRAPSVGIDVDMVSEFDPSSSDSGVVSRCAVVKPLKLRLCRPIFGRKAIGKLKREHGEPGKHIGKDIIEEIKPPKPRDPEREKRRLARKKEKRATLILGLIMGSFIACWLPFFFLYIVKPLFPNLNIPVQAFAIAFWLGYINSALNPVIYTVFNKDFRRAFRRILYK